MTHPQSLSALGLAAFGMLIWLPACAQDREEEIVGPPPTMGCCWGNSPEDGVSPGRTRPPVMETADGRGFTLIVPRGDWIIRSDQG